MNNVIISYSLFNKKNNDDEIDFKLWYNIPALIAVNLIVYPMAKIFIYMPEDLIKHPLFEILEKLSEKFELVKLKFLPYAFHDSEPILWRFKPIFDKLADTVICRDLDSLPNEQEIRATYFFLNEPQYYIQTLRTHSDHKYPITSILAGLSAYRPYKINFISNLTFNDFYNQSKSNIHGVAQNAMTDLFSKDEEWTKKYFLDCPIQSKQHQISKSLIRCKSIEDKKYKKKVNISHISDELLTILNNATVWGGEPIDFRGEKFDKLLNYNNFITFKLKKIILDCSQFTQSFYLESKTEKALSIG